MSLFPFLAVLICTMGALIVLLVVIAQQARLQAAQVTAIDTTQREKKLAEAREDARWMVEQLEKSRSATESQLTEARLQLGHFEDHARELSKRIARLEATLNDLNQHDHQSGRQPADVAAEIARVRAQIAEARRQLAQTQEKAVQRKSAFAVSPYRGNHETFQRPIYIECRADSIVLRPEGIVLSEQDLTGPLGPGNPLAAALRATREYLSNQHAGDPNQAGEPYPLLLVRPEGIGAYYAARSAMTSWGSEFGYELIEDDWKLDFRPPDPRLADTVLQAVEKARAEQRRLVAAAPSIYGRGRPSRPVYIVSPTRGGSVLARGSLAGGSPARSSRSNGVRDNETRYWAQRRGRPSGSRAGANHLGGGSPGTSGETNTPTGLATGSNATGPNFIGPNGEHVTPRTPENTDVLSGRPPREEDLAATSPGGRPRRPGEWQPKQDRKQSLSETRGRDWGLRDAAGGSVPITRPIRVDCHGDRLVVVSGNGPYSDRTIGLGPQTVDSIDTLISAVWEHMDSWGIAGQGMYWRPILSVRVAADAEARFADLEDLLEGSGLTVERKQASGEQAGQ